MLQWGGCQFLESLLRFYSHFVGKHIVDKELLKRIEDSSKREGVGYTLPDTSFAFSDFYTDSPTGIKKIPFDESRFLEVAGFIKARSAEDRLPNQLYVEVAKWFIAWINGTKLDTQCFLVYTSNPKVVEDLKLLSLRMRKMRFPNQETGTRTKTITEFMDHWKSFCVFSLSHLDDGEFRQLCSVVARQKPYLFEERYPMILLADSTQPRVKADLIQLEIR